MNAVPSRGPAANVTYKDMYHFKDNFFKLGSNVKSINVDPDINSTIKENPYASNVEIEGGEMVLQPDLSALFKAVGKKHKQGGMDVFLKPDSFIFSDDPTLALQNHEQNQFELKRQGGKFDPKANTPARVVRRNIDPKHYNKLISNITDVKKDDLVKRSSALMLQKYIDGLGRIAYLQEQKKGMPDGLPSFSTDTAPVFSQDVKDNVNATKQYGKYGGHVYGYGGRWGAWHSATPTPVKWGNTDFTGVLSDDDILRRKMQTGGEFLLPPDTVVPKSNNGFPPWFKLWTKSNTVAGRTTPTGLNSVYNDGTSIYNDYNYWKGLNGNKNFSSPDDYQRFVYNYVQKFDPDAVSNMWNKWGMTSAGKFDDSLFGARTLELSNWRPAKAPMLTYQHNISTQISPRTILNNLDSPTPSVPQKDTTSLSPNNVDGTAQGVKRADWQFTPWQKLSQGYNASKYAALQREMPVRGHLNSTYINSYLLNPEQAVADVQASANSQTNALNTLNPILRDAQASSIQGSVMNQLPGIRSQYDNANADIINRTRQYNNQVRNDETRANLANDLQYAAQASVGRQNFANMKSFLADQYMNNLMGDVSANQSLAYKLLQQNNPAYAYDWRTGNFTRNKQNILDTFTQQRGEYLNQYINKIAGDWDNLTGRDKVNLLKVMVARNFIPEESPQYLGIPGMRKGGKFYNPYK